MTLDDINIEDMHLHIFNDNSNPEPKRESFDSYSRAARAYGEWNDGGSWELRGAVADDLAVAAAIEVYIDHGSDELARAAVIEAIVRKYPQIPVIVANYITEQAVFVARGCATPTQED